MYVLKDVVFLVLATTVFSDSFPGHVIPSRRCHKRDIQFFQLHLKPANKVISEQEISVPPCAWVTIDRTAVHSEENASWNVVRRIVRSLVLLYGRLWPSDCEKQSSMSYQYKFNCRHELLWCTEMAIQWETTDAFPVNVNVWKWGKC